MESSRSISLSSTRLRVRDLLELLCNDPGQLLGSLGGTWGLWRGVLRGLFLAASSSCFCRAANGSRRASATPLPVSAVRGRWPVRPGGSPPGEPGRMAIFSAAAAAFLPTSSTFLLTSSAAFRFCGTWASCWATCFSCCLACCGLWGASAGRLLLLLPDFFEFFLGLLQFVGGLRGLIRGFLGLLVGLLLRRGVGVVRRFGDLSQHP